MGEFEVTGLAHGIFLDVQVMQENRKIIICQEKYGDDMMKTEDSLLLASHHL